MDTFIPSLHPPPPYCLSRSPQSTELSFLCFIAGFHKLSILDKVVHGIATEQLHFHFSLSCIGEGNGNPRQCSCLENPRDGGAWWAAVYGVAQSRTRLKWLSSSSSSTYMSIPISQFVPPSPFPHPVSACLFSYVSISIPALEIGSSVPFFLGHILWENHNSKWHVYPRVHCSTIYNSQDMEAT